MQLQERYASVEHEKKAEILIKILQDKITSDETDGRPLYETDHSAWDKRMMAIGSIYVDLGQISEQIKIAETLIEHRADKSNLSRQHALAAMLNSRGASGDYARAEELELQCVPYLEKLGKDSPQAISSRRIIATAVWMQGRQAEAKKLIAEIYDLIETMGKGKYAVYKDVEKRMTNEMVEDLKNKPEIDAAQET